MIKGCNHHVMPYNSGWCVISEANQKVISHFETQKKAMDYASECAKNTEGMVLLHSTPADESYELSTVALPQEENLPDMAHQSVPEDALYSQSWSTTKVTTKTAQPFDPLLGFDEYYFDI